MVTLTELNKKLKSPVTFAIPKKVSDKVNLEDFDFTDVQEIDEYSLEYTNNKNPNIKMRFYEERATINIYELLENDKIRVTTWQSGKKVLKIFDKSDFKDIF